MSEQEIVRGDDNSFHVNAGLSCNSHCKGFGLLPRRQWNSLRTLANGKIDQFFVCLFLELLLWWQNVFLTEVSLSLSPS